MSQGSTSQTLLPGNLENYPNSGAGGRRMRGSATPLTGVHGRTRTEERKGGWKTDGAARPHQPHQTGPLSQELMCHKDSVLRANYLGSDSSFTTSWL